MTKSTRLLVTLSATGALLALPVATHADPGKSQGKAKSQKGASKRCAKTPSVGYSVRGTLVSATADDPATPANEGSITFTVTGANKHARSSGEIADQDATKKGVQVAGATYTIGAADPFTLRLEGYEAPDTVSPGDEVHASGKVARTKSKCAAEGTSTADRYGAVDIRRVTISDRDPDA
jgi:hypothetical protein